jgi:RNA polymerase sigma-70 factor (ECF subfamily)
VEDAERRAVLDQWYRAHAHRVLAYLLHRTDPQTAQDVLQEVFVIAFARAAQLPDPPVGWLFGTARRVLANRRRSFRRQDQLMERLLADIGPESSSPDFELKQAFTQCLATLSPGDREVLTLAGWYDLAPAQAAEALGCTASTYAVRLHRARTRLAAALDAAGYRGDSAAGQFAEALRG